jgi:mevalonate kinase
MSSASAPGKIILFGEHAVVYARPALAVPVLQVHADVTVNLISASGGKDWRSQTLIEAPDIGLFTSLDSLLAHQPTHPLATVIINVFQRLGVAPPPLKIRVTSSIPVASGLGSGAAVSVALVRALAAAVSHTLSDEQVNALAYEIEKLHHGTPSGIDNTVITYARPVYFVRGQPIETFNVHTPFTVVIANTGIAAPTKESVGDVRKLWEADNTRWEQVFDKVGEIAQQARAAIETGETSALGPLMDANHALLQSLTVSSAELDRLVLTAKAAGADGAKLSGGGRGGNMIALVQPQSAELVAAALRSAGAQSTITTIVR